LVQDLQYWVETYSASTVLVLTLETIEQYFLIYLTFSLQTTLNSDWTREFLRFTSLSTSFTPLDMVDTILEGKHHILIPKRSQIFGGSRHGVSTLHETKISLLLILQKFIVIHTQSLLPG
jgi:hypothetical protein